MNSVAGLVGKAIKWQCIRSICGLPMLIEGHMENPAQPAFSNVLFDASQLDFIKRIAPANSRLAFVVRNEMFHLHCYVT